ncbi:MAG: hypothetical protein CVU81_00670 [Euryarchaeota archaeon HGW-Euryarchaeota-1]|nr:MAG: hypothetical protein CVU81_00670 [Euryarchaeota archaeon HGW-Euryarchaeota-1]
MAHNKTLMPGESAGLMSFNENTLSKIQIPPLVVIGICILIIIIFWIFHSSA